MVPGAKVHHILAHSLFTVETSGLYIHKGLSLEHPHIAIDCYPDETQRVHKFHIGIKIGSHKGFKQ